MQANSVMKATGGRAASRERRAQLVQGKAALPPPSERSRSGQRDAALAAVAAPMPAAQPKTPQPKQQPAAPAAVQTAPATPAPAPAPSAPSSQSFSSSLTGRAYSKARRAQLIQGKAGLQKLNTLSAQAAEPSPSMPSTAANVIPQSPVVQGAPMHASGRAVARAVRAERARHGRGSAEAARPSGRVRDKVPLNYAPKVANSETYAGRKVTGVRVGRGFNTTGDERGADVQVTGSQYIGKETGFSPREGGAKVGAARTQGGLVVTGSQVRSKVMITGDESNAGIRITGEADQELSDDLLERREQGAYTSMQFQRQNNPHGHTVFGTNLGRSIKSIGSRDRARVRVTEHTDGGQQISGTALGRSPRVTGDEPGSCRPITGDQYLMPAARQAMCDRPTGAGQAMRRGNHHYFTAQEGEQGERLDPVTGEKVTVSETWTRQRITGVDVEHNPNVSGDEYGVCSAITGTPYAGPGQYEASCPVDATDQATQRVAPNDAPHVRVTGDTPLNVDHVTGTQRGSDRGITGTPYFIEEAAAEENPDPVAALNSRFSVRSPQREAQLQAPPPASASRITGSFAVGEGKITGNQEFHFNPRAQGGQEQANTRLTGEGRVAGPPITGSAWSAQSNVTGTEGYIAAKRNPSERAGDSHAFAGSALFKTKGKHEPARQIVTGMVGWSPKSAAKVTLSGGAQG